MSSMTQSSMRNSARVKAWEAAWHTQLSAAMLNDPHPELRIINLASITKVKKAARYIKYMYLHKQPIKAFTWYLEFVKKYARTPDLKRLEQFQIKDMLMAVLNQEVAWLRTRRGGKTRDLTLVAIFWAIIGKDVIWFTPQSDQQKQAVQYFLANPFFARSTENDYWIYNAHSAIEMSNLTLGKSASKGKDCIIYDEGAKVPKGYQIYDYYKYSRVIVSAKLWEGDKHILSASTAARNTAIEEEVELLLKRTPELVSVHPYTDCWWISEDWVQQERMANLNDPWFVDQEYLTLFVNRGGSIFDNIVVMSIDDMKDLPITHIGADINKREALTFAHIDERTKSCFILLEREFDWVKDNDCFSFIRGSTRFKYRGHEFEIAEEYAFEVEGMGYNEKEAFYIAQHVQHIFVNQDFSDEVKGDRMTIAKGYTIYIDPAFTPYLYQDLRNAVYHPYKGIYLKDAAHPCHWLDAFFHLVGAKWGQFVQAPSHKPEVHSLPHHLQDKFNRSRYD